MKINKSVISRSFCFFAWVLFLLLFVLNGTQAQMMYEKEKIIKDIDYTDLYNWAAHPLKKDYSDSNNIVHTNDDTVIKAHVFFIHPTTYTDAFINGKWNADINDVELNNKTDQSTILYQSTAFKNNTVIFAPRYRQAHIKSFYVEDSISEPYFEIAYRDVRRSFEYYLEKENNGFPIIIAAHSQGTKHAGRLLKEFFENTSLKNRLICAYIIGMPIPDTYFSSLKPCLNENETGCFVGWRTYKRGYTPKEIEKENFKSIVINPLSWTDSDVIMEKSKNEGGVLSNYRKLVPHVVDGEIHGNLLWSCKPDVFGKIFFTKKNFHIGDINLFYYSIHKNVKTRINSFFKKNKN